MKSFYFQSFPKTQEFGIVKIGTTLNTHFHLFNYGDAVVRFTLTCLNRSFNMDLVKITPINGEVKPKEKCKIDLEIDVGSIGDNELIIMYSDNAESTIGQRVEGRDVFKVSYKCQMFTIMVN